MGRPRIYPDGGAGKHAHPSIALHLPADLLAALHAYAQGQRVPPSRSDVVRVAIREFLEREGYWPLPAQDAKGEGQPSCPSG